jgi:hypothetical protein
MRIEKSQNHKSFFVKNKIVYEKLSNRPTRKVRTLTFHYPDKDFLTEDHVSYLNRHYDYYNKPAKPPENTIQTDLFT